jgi:hypothetical protein
VLQAGDRGCAWGSDPDEDFPGLVDGEPFRLDQGFLECLQLLVVELELELEHPIGHPAAALEQGDCLVHDLFKGHHRTSASVASPPACGPMITGQSPAPETPRHRR